MIDDIMGFIFGLLVGVILHMVLVNTIGHQWNYKITKHEQCARFNSVTGNFEWLDELKDKE